MSGHSKWSTIKRKKGENDSQRAKMFTKIGREIAVAVKSGGADPESNSKLKDIISKARSNNMPNENVTRCIKKAAGDSDADNYEEIIYEGYGPSGVAVIVETLTDNRNRTAGDMRHYFDKYGGNLGPLGCVSFMFDKKGIIIVEQDGSIDEDTLMMDALDAGADDFSSEKTYFEISTDPNILSQVKNAIEEKGYIIASAEVDCIPQTYTTLSVEKDILLMNKLIDMLDDNDDVQNIYHNWNNPDDEDE